jgi:hypothetical protein
MVRLALFLLSLVAALGVGGIGLGLASAGALAAVGELAVNCLECGEQWTHLPAMSLAHGCVAVFRRRRTLRDECPKCHSHHVVFGHRHQDQGPSTS